MSDIDRGSLEVEAPVNPYSLLEAVNSSSETAHRSWLIFLGLMTYMLIAVAGVTHQDLLLNNEISLPMVQVKIELTHFFLFAPIVLVLIHLGVISQLVMLARKAIEFDSAMRLLEVSDRRSHPLRLELHNFFFVQAIAGPQRANVMGMFLHLMSWLTLAILPVLLLLFIQTMFLPYHSVPTTWAHRFALVADIVILTLIGVFLVRAETSFFHAFFRSILQNPLSFIVTVVVLSSVLFFSFFVATVPGEFMARAGERVMQLARGGGGDSNRNFLVGVDFPFVGASSDGALFGLFYRNLVVTDVDLVKDASVTANEPTLNLRGRDLRFARLDRSDLHQADLTGVNLEGASLVRTDLRNVMMNCASLDAMLLGEGRKKANCASARDANFTKANLTNANLLGLDLSGSNMEEALLSDVVLSHAILAGVNFAGAHLERADFTGGVNLRAAVFQLASLQGANLLGADLRGANLNNANLQGVALSWANLDGAIMSDANLDGTDMTKVSLRGANLGNAKLRGSDLRGAIIWDTSPPAAADVRLTDLSSLVMQPLGVAGIEELLNQIKLIKQPEVQTRLRNALSGIMNVEKSELWEASDDRRSWDQLVLQGAVAGDAIVGYRPQVTDFLTDLMCNNPWKVGAVATGLLRQATNTVKFRGDGNALYQRFQDASCGSGRGVPTEIVGNFLTSQAAARAQR